MIQDTACCTKGYCTANKRSHQETAGLKRSQSNHLAKLSHIKGGITCKHCRQYTTASPHIRRRKKVLLKSRIPVCTVVGGSKKQDCCFGNSESIRNCMMEWCGTEAVRGQTKFASIQHQIYMKYKQHLHPVHVYIPFSTTYHSSVEYTFALTNCDSRIVFVDAAYIFASNILQ